MASGGLFSSQPSSPSLIRFSQNKLSEEIPEAEGATYCPLIFGSDKTTVSVATGQNDFYPLYMSNGLVHNTVRRGHRGAVTLIGFLAIPKSASAAPWASNNVIDYLDPSRQGAS